MCGKSAKGYWEIKKKQLNRRKTHNRLYIYIYQCLLWSANKGEILRNYKKFMRKSLRDWSPHVVSPIGNKLQQFKTMIIRNLCVCIYIYK